MGATLILHLLNSKAILAKLYLAVSKIEKRKKKKGDGAGGGRHIPWEQTTRMEPA